MEGLHEGLEAMRVETGTLRQQRQAEERCTGAEQAQAKQMATANAL